MRFILILLFAPIACIGQDFIANVNKGDSYGVIEDKVKLYIISSGGVYKGVKTKREGKKCIALIPRMAPGASNAEMWSEYYFVFEKTKLVYYTEMLSISQFNSIKDVMDSGWGFAQSYIVDKTTRYHWTTPFAYVELVLTPGKAKFEMNYTVR